MELTLLVSGTVHVGFGVFWLGVSVLTMAIARTSGRVREPKDAIRVFP